VNKRMFYTKALLASLPVATKLLPAAPEDPAAESIDARVAGFAGKIAEELTLVFESQMVVWDEMDAEPSNRVDVDYIPSTKNLSGQAGGWTN
jgi:hypothetical protein